VRPNQLRLWLIAVLVVAAVLSVVGNKAGSRFIGWLSFAAFLVAVFLYLNWRRTIARQRRRRVLDREAKTDETRPHPDE